MSRPLVEVRDLEVCIGDRAILHDLSFTVDSGTCTALVGETGSGKSMTCRVIAGLLEPIGGRVTAGAVTFDSESLLGRPPSYWRGVRGKRVAWIPQASMSALNPVRRVGSQILETLKQLDPERATRARAAELLSVVGLGGKVDNVIASYPHRLSGGMRQRVMIALALAGNPELLIADEPTTALDVTVQRSILELLSELRRTRGMATILVTHDMGVAKTMADNVAVMYAGTIVEQGAVDSVLQNPQHAYTRTLLAARPSAVAPAPHLRVKTIESPPAEVAANHRPTTDLLPLEDL